MWFINVNVCFVLCCFDRQTTYWNQDTCALVRILPINAFEDLSRFFKLALRGLSNTNICETDTPLKIHKHLISCTALDIVHIIIVNKLKPSDLNRLVRNAFPSLRISRCIIFPALLIFVFNFKHNLFELYWDKVTSAHKSCVVIVLDGCMASSAILMSMTLITIEILTVEFNWIIRAVSNNAFVHAMHFKYDFWKCQCVFSKYCIP